MDNAMLRDMMGQPWAILPSTLSALIERVKAGADLSEFGSAAIPRNTARQPGAVAVLPLMGIIHQRRSPIEDMLGISIGTSTEAFAEQLRRAIDSPEVKAIVIDVDSPGGTVAGVQELSDEIFKLRGTKPIVAVSDALNASAAYWISSQVDELIVTPSAIIGSIGIIVAHEDLTGAAEQAGVKVTLFSAGEFKTVGHEMEPVTDETAALVQGMVDDQYANFVGAVARGRGVSVAAVRAGFGKGFVLTAKAAVRQGVADRVATLRETLIRLGAPEGSAEATERRSMRRMAASPTAELEIEREKAAVAAGDEVTT